MIIKYELELTDVRHPLIVKEAEYDFYLSVLNDPEKIASMFNECFALNKKAEEHFYMLALDTKLQPLGVFEVSHGTINMTLANTREIFIRALLCGASSIVVVHNHPSGLCEISVEDIKVYHQLTECGKLVGIPLQDFIIVGNTYYSFKMQYLC